MYSINNIPTQKNLRLPEGEFKKQRYNHAQSFRSKNYSNNTTLTLSLSLSLFLSLQLCLENEENKKET